MHVLAEGRRERSQFVTQTKLIVNLTSGKCLCVSELADRPLSRMRGLMGRRGLLAGEGLLVSPAPAIHTAFMRFPIDVLFLDRNMRVLDIVQRLRPWRVACKHKARAVLELSAGESARHDVGVGDRLELCERRANGAAPSDAAPTSQSNAAVSGLTPARDLQRGQHARLQPLRVLLVSPDRHFRTVISLLLERRNCTVVATANTARITELIARESADVVVIDASQSSIAATVAIVEESARRVRVVLVSDDEARSGRHDRRTLAKWGPFGDLLAVIEDDDQRRGPGGETDE